jgi:hypothetical protein
LSRFVRFGNGVVSGIVYRQQLKMHDPGFMFNPSTRTDTDLHRNLIAIFIPKKGASTMGADDRASVDQHENISTAPHKIGEEVLDPHVRDDHGDPHQAALDDAEDDGHVTASTWAAIFFLGITCVSSLNFTLNSFVPVATLVAMDLQGNLNNVNWVSGGWSLGGSVAFAVAGQLSDYFGRKDVVVVGQLFPLVGHLVGATAQSFGQVLAAMVLLGIGTGTTCV